MMLRAFWVVVALVLFFIAFAGLSRVEAHSWYEPACCSGMDCSPVNTGQVEWTPDGWKVKAGFTALNGWSLTTDIIVPFEKVKPIPEFARTGQQQMHVCLGPTNIVRCVYYDAGI